MAIKLTCADCGYSKQVDDETPQTCPQCDGTMKKPAYKAKSGPTSSDKETEKAKPAEVEKPKAKAAPKPADDDDEDEKPKAKAKPKPAPKDDDDEEDEKPRKKPAKQEEALSLDDDEDEGGGDDFVRDGKAAKRIGIDPGFDDKALMRAVGKEMARGEVLHWAGRPSMEVAKKQGKMFLIVGIVIIAVAIVGAVAIFMIDAIPKVAVIAPIFIALVGVAFAVLAPKMGIKQAERGWYAVTDRRAIVFMAHLWGKKGNVESYEPSALRKMWVRKSFWVTGAGDLVFKTEITDTTTKWVDKRGKTVKTTGQRTEHHHGFIGIDDVKDIETLVHDVLLQRGDENDDEDEKDDSDDE